jgi:hypothetical protein
MQTRSKAEKRKTTILEVSNKTMNGGGKSTTICSIHGGLSRILSLFSKRFFINIVKSRAKHEMRRLRKERRREINIIIIPHQEERKTFLIFFSSSF